MSSAGLVWTRDMGGGWRAEGPGGREYYISGAAPCIHATVHEGGHGHDIALADSVAQAQRLCEAHSARQDG